MFAHVHMFAHVGTIAAAVFLAVGCGSDLPEPVVVNGTERPLPTRAGEPLMVAADGEIVGADRVPVTDRMASTVVLSLRDDEQEPVAIELAPGWYLDERGLGFEPGERVQVVGTQAPPAGARRGVITAWEVRTPERSFRLRDASGRPLWHESAGPGGL